LKVEIVTELKRVVTSGRRIVLALDNDNSGKQAAGNVAAALVAGGIAPNRISLYTWPCKDASDYLQMGGEREALLVAFKSAPRWLETIIAEAAYTGENAGVNEKAMAELFSTLANLPPFELPYWRELTCEMLRLRKSDFDRWLRAARRAAATFETSNDHYQVQNGRIVRRLHDSSGNLVLQPLCNFNAWIAQDVLRDNGQEVERQLRLAGELNHKPLPMANVRAGEFARMDWIIREWGSAAIIEPGNHCREHLRAAIQHLSHAVV
jgi:hypothetical protein